jgi:hypothetical protein
MSAKVCAMAEGPVCATEEWRRERISDSGMFLLEREGVSMVVLVDG